MPTDTATPQAPPPAPLGPSDTLVCPVDDLTFRPWFADGACPVCGWRPEGVTVGQSWVERVNPAWPWLVTLFAVGLLMALLALAAA
jgi:hypothetical protein